MIKAISAVNDLLMKLWWIPASLIIAALLIVISWAFDREPPIRIISVPSSIAYRGGVAVIDPFVKRDLTRKCDARIVRTLTDSEGVTINLGIVELDDWLIDERARRTPGRAPIAVPVPIWASLGPARYDSVIHYTCNPLHNIWPIDVSWSAEVMIK